MRERHSFGSITNGFLNYSKTNKNKHRTTCDIRKQREIQGEKNEVEKNIYKNAAAELAGGSGDMGGCGQL